MSLFIIDKKKIAARGVWTVFQLLKWFMAKKHENHQWEKTLTSAHNVTCVEGQTVLCIIWTSSDAKSDFEPTISADFF